MVSLAAPARVRTIAPLSSPEPEIIVRARAGHEPALIELFDATICDVYGLALAELGNVRAAERITELAVEQMPRALHHRRWRTVAEFRGYIVSVAEREMASRPRPAEASRLVEGFHTVVRRLFLFASLGFAAGYGGSFLVS
jgi:DNA-directed RNA polymerase specialized sigma24 family protein